MGTGAGEGGAVNVADVGTPVAFDDADDFSGGLLSGCVGAGCCTFCAQEYIPTFFLRVFRVVVLKSGFLVDDLVCGCFPV